MSNQLQSFPIQVFTVAQLAEWRDGVGGASAQAAKLRESGYVPIMFTPEGRFSWLCPGCGYFSHGTVGEHPVSGWEEPRWTVDGLPDHLTMVPSLGCPRWRAGTCIGHWWVRDGELVPA